MADVQTLGGRVITAGAMTAHTDLTLHVLRRLFGAALARKVGGIMLVDGARTSQHPFMALQRTFDDALVQNVSPRRCMSAIAPCIAASMPLPACRLRRLRHVNQSDVTRLVAVLIVEGLEAIYIDRKNRERIAMTYASGPFLVGKLGKGAAIAGVGQRVMTGLSMDVLPEPLRCVQSQQQLRTVEKH